MATESGKKIKRGEVLFREGEAVSSIVMIQSGKIALMSERSGKSLEVTTLGAGGVLNEHALIMNGRNEFTAEALPRDQGLGSATRDHETTV